MCTAQGMNYRPSKKPEKPITIYAYEASPFCMQTRERLTELEIPHLYKNCARNSMKRDEITEKWGASLPVLSFATRIRTLRVSQSSLRRILYVQSSSVPS